MSKLPEGKVEGFTPKKFFERLSRKRHVKTTTRGESFGTKPDITLARVQINIRKITNQELSHVIANELLRRQTLTLNDIKTTLEKTMAENKATKEKKRKESLKRQKEYNTPLRRYLRLAMLNEEHQEDRLKALMEWKLTDLKDVMKQIAQVRTMREIPIITFERSKSDLMSVISYKTMLESKSPEGN